MGALAVSEAGLRSDSSKLPETPCSREDRACGDGQTRLFAIARFCYISRSLEEAQRGSHVIRG